MNFNISKLSKIHIFRLKTKRKQNNFKKIIHALMLTAVKVNIVV